MAHFFTDMCVERNTPADLQSILHLFEALAEPDAEDHHARIACPTLILSGSEDSTHQAAFALKDRIPGCEMKIIMGRGTRVTSSSPGYLIGSWSSFSAGMACFPHSKRSDYRR